MVYDSAAIMREMQIFSGSTANGSISTATHAGDGPYNDSKNFMYDWICCQSGLSLLFGYFEISSHEAATIKQLYDYKTKRNSYIFYSVKHAGITVSKDETRLVKVSVTDVYKDNSPANIKMNGTYATVEIKYDIKKVFTFNLGIIEIPSTTVEEHYGEGNFSAESVVNYAGGYN